jgi:hypothetical protein
VNVFDIQEPDRWAGLKAQRISWDDGSITNKKFNCGLPTENYYVEKEPKP